MKLIRQVALGAALCVTAVSMSWAQGANDQQRPGSSTIVGDTGLWFVPIAETLPKGKWSAGLQRVDINRSEGFVNVEDIGGMFAFGATDRVEVFGAFARRGADTDLINPKLTGLGQPQDYHVNQGWATGLSDINLGAKFGLHSQSTGDGYGAALRLGAKIPGSSHDDGLGNGKPGVWFDLVGSREVAKKVDLTMSAGLNFRTSPEGYQLSHGFIFGAGAGFPSRSNFKVIGELTGEALFDHGMTFTGTQGPTTPPASWEGDATREYFGGIQYHWNGGAYIGAGVNYAASHRWDRKNYQPTHEPDNQGQDKWAFQVRFGYYPGVRNYEPPPPAPPAPPVQPTAPPNRPPTVRARCEPCTVQVGRQIMVSADATDPDGDTLRYRWTGPTGTFANAAERQTQWTAPGQPGAVPLTVTVDDGKGGTASDTVTIQVVAPPRKEYTFEDVHFDFDRYSLRAEATRILDEAIKAMSEDPNLRLTVEGHTCNIGTVEYNLALGDRRANAVREYLASRGVAATRLQTVSYGEERPKHDNSREETRRLNRRAALTIRMQ